MVFGADGGLVESQPEPPGLLRGQHRGGSWRGNEDDSFVFDQHHQRPVPTERIVAANGPAGFSHAYDIGS
jgi:hypothetical protein